MDKAKLKPRDTTRHIAKVQGGCVRSDVASIRTLFDALANQTFQRCTTSNMRKTSTATRSPALQQPRHNRCVALQYPKGPPWCDAALVEPLVLILEMALKTPLEEAAESLSPQPASPFREDMLMFWSSVKPPGRFSMGQ